MKHSAQKPHISVPFLTTAGLLLAAPLSHAHHAMGGATPTTSIEGMLSGIAHPVIGLDHFAFLIIAALLSFTLQGKARYLVPLGFVAATVAGTLYHLASAELPMAETVIALSVLLGGMAVMLRHNIQALTMAILFAAIGVFHGYAYGESIIGAEQTPLLSYLMGFALIQYAVITGGAKLLSMLAARSEKAQSLAMRFGGAITATTGAVFLGINLA